MESTIDFVRIDDAVAALHCRKHVWAYVSRLSPGGRKDRVRVNSRRLRADC